MKDIFSEIRTKIEFECAESDLYIITDDISPIHENQTQNFTLEHFGINRFTHLKFSIKFVSLWFPAPENAPMYITLGNKLEISQKDLKCLIKEKFAMLPPFFSMISRNKLLSSTSIVPYRQQSIIIVPIMSSGEVKIEYSINIEKGTTWTHAFNIQIKPSLSVKAIKQTLLDILK